MLLEDNPLKAKPQKKNRKNKENEQQFIEMEEKFRPYSTLTSTFPCLLCFHF